MDQRAPAGGVGCMCWRQGRIASLHLTKTRRGKWPGWTRFRPDWIYCPCRKCGDGLCCRYTFDRGFIGQFAPFPTRTPQIIGKRLIAEERLQSCVPAIFVRLATFHVAGTERTSDE